MEFEAKTEGEKWILISSKMDRLSDVMERFADSLESLEKGKIQNHEDRLIKVERNQSEQSGALKLVQFIALALGIISVSIALLK